MIVQASSCRIGIGQRGGAGTDQFDIGTHLGDLAHLDHDELIDLGILLFVVPHLCDLVLEESVIEGNEVYTGLKILKTKTPDVVVHPDSFRVRSHACSRVVPGTQEGVYGRKTRDARVDEKLWP